MSAVAGADGTAMLPVVSVLLFLYHMTDSVMFPCTNDPSYQRTMIMMRDYCYINTTMDWASAKNKCSTDYNASLPRFHILTVNFDLTDAIGMQGDFWLDARVTELPDYANYSAYVGISADNHTSSGLAGRIKYAHITDQRLVICRKDIDMDLTLFLKTELNRIVGQLIVSKNETNKKLRTLASMPDERSSAHIVGTISISMLCVLIGIMLSLDTPTFIMACIRISIASEEAAAIRKPNVTIKQDNFYI